MRSAIVIYLSSALCGSPNEYTSAATFETTGAAPAEQKAHHHDFSNFGRLHRLIHL